MKNVRDRVRSPIFVGRDFEMGRLEEALAKAGLGQAAVVLIAGEAGVGKTRLVHEFEGRARAAGSLVLEGGCVQLGGEGLPLGPVIEALRSVPQFLSPDQLAAMLGPGRMDLARLVPQLARPSDDAADVGAFDGSGQGRLFEHLLGLLVRLGERQPLLLVLEDLHWLAWPS